MFKRLLQTDDSLTAFIVRITLALVILPHGAQKLLGLFGGYGFKATINYFTSQGTPAILAFLVILTESIGALLILFGFTTRLWAAMLTVIMLVAISIHQANGFFMNWSGTQSGEGFEYHLLVIGINLALIIKGAGRWSVDRQLSK
ncbi:DoxX family protein [Chitinophaga sp. RAB17]|uniref:DoxX family protein n=1 Tax=Chitinophaga sp. RAB17 TaxID=3233049 RepID=UPI003F92AE7D